MKSITIPSVFLILLVSLLITPLLAQSDDAQIRFLHVIPEAEAIDIYLNGDIAIENLAYGQPSTELFVPIEAYKIAVATADTSDVLWEQNLVLEQPEGDTKLALTFIAADTSGFEGYRDELNPIQPGNGRLLFVNALADKPSINIVFDKEQAEIGSGVEAGASLGTYELPPDDYSFSFINSDTQDPILEGTTFGLNAQSYTVAVIGGNTDAATVTLVQATVTDSDNVGYLRIINASQTSPQAAFALNDALVTPALLYQQSTAYMTVPNGTYTLTMTMDDDSLTTEEVTIQTGGYVSAIVIGDEPEIILAEEIVDNVSANAASLQLINAFPESTDVNFVGTSGNVIASDMQFGDASDAIVFPAGEITLDVEIALGNQEGIITIPPSSLYGGVSYQAVLFPGDKFSAPTLIYFPNSINQSIASAPSAGTKILRADTTSADSSNESSSPDAIDETSVESTTPADTANTVDAAPTSAPANPTPVPQPTVAPTQAPVVIAEPGLPIGRVTVDPDSGLHLREFPTSEARSLGLAPGGADLEVLGREGAFTPIEGVTTLFDTKEFIDPAEGLEGNQDADPALVWLRVQYDDPELGTIEAWVNALYVAVRTPAGETVRLANLVTIPLNTAGRINGGTQ